MDNLPCMDSEVTVDGDHEPCSPNDAALLSVIEEMRDYVSSGLIDPRLPTEYLPGTLYKKALLAIRLEHGLRLWVSGDACNLPGTPVAPESPPGCFPAEEQVMAGIDDDF